MAGEGGQRDCLRGMGFPFWGRRCSGTKTWWTLHGTETYFVPLGCLCYMYFIRIEKDSDGTSRGASGAVVGWAVVLTLMCLLRQWPRTSDSKEHAQATPDCRLPVAGGQPWRPQAIPCSAGSLGLLPNRCRGSRQGPPLCISPSEAHGFPSRLYL